MQLRSFLPVRMVHWPTPAPPVARLGFLGRLFDRLSRAWRPKESSRRYTVRIVPDPAARGGSTRPVPIPVRHIPERRP